jgi:hypothetical protein
MLSNPLHRFSAYNALPSSNMLSNGHLPSNHMHSGLHNLADNSQYGLQQLQHVDVHPNDQVHRSHNNKHRQHPYSAGPVNGRSGSNGATGPIRRRISRACDQCNQLRTKCDGQNPCAHCVGKSSAIPPPQVQNTTNASTPTTLVESVELTIFRIRTEL